MPGAIDAGLTPHTHNAKAFARDPVDRPLSGMYLPQNRSLAMIQEPAADSHLVFLKQIVQGRPTLGLCGPGLEVRRLEARK
jgi:hypothetical protein